MIKKNDFIEIEYTAKVKETGMIFDTTSETIAKKEEINRDGMIYGHVVICVGEAHVLQGLDNELVGKEAGKEYNIGLEPENAFGKKSAKMVQLIATNKFTTQGIQPQVGLQVNIDGMLGTIKTVTGGRTLVDFNHPLAGQDVVYTVKINRIVTDAAEKVQGLVNLQFGRENAKVEHKDGEITIKHNIDLPKEFEQKFSDQIHSLITDIKKVIFLKETRNKEEEKKGDVNKEE